jgi:hypothetical protein
MTNDRPTPTTRRDLLKKAAFVVPIVLSLPAGAAFAKKASGRPGHNGGEQDGDYQGNN